jgi:hypothetical protein
MSYARANAALGGKLADLEGRALGIKLLSTEPVMIRTAEAFEGKEYQAALRARVIDIEDAAELGTFLVFWDGVKQTLVDNANAGIDFLVGALTKEPHPTNPDHDLWVFGEATVTDAQIEAAGVS